MKVEVQPLAGFDQLLTYEVSQRFSGQIKVGSLVQVPLGRRRALGVVFSLNSKSIIDPSKLRRIYSVVQPEPVLSPDLLPLARWIGNYYSCSMESVLETMIPAVVREGKGAKSIKWIEVLDSALQGQSNEEELKRAPKQRVLLDELIKLGKPVRKSEVVGRMGFGENLIKGLAEKGLIREKAEVVDRVAYDDEIDFERVNPNLELTEEQSRASSELKQLVRKKEFGVQLLHGVTGSGKTEVYFEAMNTALDEGGSVLFLVPEVALAPQTVSRIRSRFAKKNQDIVVWHSHLSGGERLDAWRSLTSGKARIVVGARSAVFAPLPSLRLIIVDEEHELAYKQEDTPRYHGRDLAVFRAKLNDALCILGSATPSLETFRNVEKKKYGLSQLKNRIDGRKLPLMRIVDMRLDARKEKGSAILSQTLVEAMRQRYEKKEQIILFLNRRGFNTTMLCTECGQVEKCKDCSIALTFHRTDGYLRCHLCGFRKRAPAFCPSCKSVEIRRRGHGTQRIEDLVAGLMPKSAKIRRIDADMMTKKNLFREAMRDFRVGKIDILVGTQMIAKGLDFPNVTLVGVLDADLPLRMEDFRASERAFQLLVQVAGRAGRGDRSGEVYVQTYSPHASSIQFARRSDVEGFLEEELAIRKELEYPPFRHLIRHVFKSRSLEKCEFYSQQWKQALEADPVKGMEIKGPALAPIERIKGFYRFHLFYLTASISSSLRQLEERRASFTLDPEIRDTLDVDAHQLS